jgi:HEPN domain-containing protein
MRFIVAQASLQAVVFHAQQAGEKALKGFLTNGRKPFPKTHDLGMLLDLAIQLDPTLGNLKEHCFVLTPYAVEFQYPGNIFEPTNENAKAAVRLAKEMVVRIREKIKE